jgi:hypothetical protein
MPKVFWIALFCLFIFGPASAMAETKKPFTLNSELAEINILIFDKPVKPKLKNLLVKSLQSNININDQRKVKITASILALTLGPFGVHRLYLGTSPVVPVVYVATVGGAIGILPFIDFVVIVFSKDLSPYMNNNRIFMWANK